MITGRYPVDLNAPISSLKRVGARTALRLSKLGITTVRRLLWHIPSRYEDFSQSVPIEQARVDDTVSIQGKIDSISTRVSWKRRRMTITTARLSDESSSMRLVWFNQAFLTDTLLPGTTLSVAGKVRLDKQGPFLSSPVYEKMSMVINGNLRHTGRLIPVYPETAGMTSKFLRFLVQPILEYGEIEDYMPNEIIKQQSLPALSDALMALHYPRTLKEADLARKRLAFDDVMMFQVRALRQRRSDRQIVGTPVLFDEKFMKKVVSSLPWDMTRDQKIALFEVLKDMERPFPMNRLLQGDVGSGKTAVALCASMQVAEHGFQSVILSPTETLAQQHYATALKLCVNYIDRIALLTGSQAQLNGHDMNRSALKLQIARGEIPFTIGTHAIIQKDVRFGKLALVVVDEQHRFGIKQRSALIRSDQAGNGHVPHLLSMTATPIPRTLALTVFGDLDISTIRSKPAGRKSIETSLIKTSNRKKMESFIREEASQGRQTFVVCPAIETPDGLEKAMKSKTGRGLQSKIMWAQVKAVRDEYERLSKKIFPDLNVAMMHGKLKPREKRAIMTKFRDGWYDVLVSTSVIEVGVDIPNATIMVIENADRFGLAQLHQFRGRVGRDEHKSYCFLAPSSDSSARERLAVMVKSDDGFELAEYDLKFRGPGEFFGIKQSGIPDLTMSALADLDLVKAARVEARNLLKDDPNLTAHPLFAKQLEQLAKLSHSE